ncbi:hypothetical protein GGI07_004302 [Coemansia sp. Benny D115]|nr:hypothetical protein GGI07_004302 [Coemansia sp. Benny D115]
MNADDGVHSAGGLERAKVLGLIQAQLAAYGYEDLSAAVAAQSGTPKTEASTRLADLAARGLRSELEDNGDDDDDGVSTMPATPQAHASTETGRYDLWYKTKHKGAATAAAFSVDGRYIATGSADTSLKLIDVSRVRSPLAGSARREDKPVIRTLYNHEAGITGVAFHPNGLVLASCAADRSIKLFDLTAASGKHAFHSLRDNHVFSSIAFHPSGEFLVAATDAPEPRLFDVRSGQAFLLRAAGSTSALTRVAYASTGGLLAASSTDGCVRLWDGRSGTCTRTLSQAHGGRAATGVVFSRNAKYLLTTGRDSTVRLWDVASGRQITAYEGALLDSPDSQAVFSHDEATVLAADDRSNAVVAWDAADARLLGNRAEHSSHVTCVAASPVAASFMTCSTDECVRYWSAEGA